MFFFKNILCHNVGYESSRGLGTNWSKVGTKRLSLGTNHLGTKDPWVRNDWIPGQQRVRNIALINTEREYANSVVNNAIDPITDIFGLRNGRDSYSF